MRILHIVGTMSAESGGPAEVARMLVEFAPPHVTSEIVTCDHPGEPALATLSCPVHALGNTRPGFFYSRRLIPWLRANRARFDGVIVHGLWTYPSLAAWRALAGHTPYIVFAHGMLDPWFKRAYPLKHAKKWGYWLVAQYWILRRASRVLFTTETERDLARQSFWLSRWEPMVVALGTTPPPADTASLLSAFHTRCPGLDGKRFLLFLGRIDRKKGCDLLVEAFALLTTDTDLHLIMAGPDPHNWAAELQPQSLDIAARIHWPGMLYGDAKWGALAACEAFILISHQENFGIAVAEALATGRPVLISDQVNIAPDITADNCGLVQPDTPEGAHHLLHDWLALSEKDRETMRANALTTFATRYDMRTNAAATFRVFERAKEQR